MKNEHCHSQRSVYLAFDEIEEILHLVEETRLKRYPVQFHDELIKLGRFGLVVDGSEDANRCKSRQTLCNFAKS